MFAASILPMVDQMRGATTPLGVALAFASDATDACIGDWFALLIVDAEGVVLERFGPYAEDDVTAIWRGIAAKTGLPRMILREDGTLAAVSRQIGRVVLGTTCSRRRHRFPNRRPRFLARRKIGTCLVRPLIACD